jgi:hypothetical protein
VFDAPTREESVSERTRSNTPLQALTLLNDPSYVEAARVLAERASMVTGGGLEGQLRWAHRRVLSREPEPRVLSILKDLYKKHLSEYAAQSGAATRILKIGNKPSNPKTRPIHVAALTSVCRTLLNLHETITRL